MTHFPIYPVQIEPHGRPIDGPRRVWWLIVLAAVLTMLGGCAGGTFSRQSADEIVGVAATPESRQCRLELAVTFAVVIMADNTIAGNDAGEVGALGASVARLTGALQRARTAAPELREVQVARTLVDLAQLTSSRLRRLVGRMVVAGGVPSEGQILGFVRSSVIADAAIAAIREAVRSIDGGERTLAQCQGAADAELAVQVGRLEAAARPR